MYELKEIIRCNKTNFEVRRIIFDLLNDFDNFVDEYKFEIKKFRIGLPKSQFSLLRHFFLYDFYLFFYIFFFFFISGGLLVPVDVTVHAIMGGLSNSHFKVMDLF